jgi:hypothetical protein
MCALLLVAGCQVTHEDESSTRKQQDSALNDPFKYGPDAQKMQNPEEDVDPTDITGGGTSNLNKKLLKRDLDKVFGTD